MKLPEPIKRIARQFLPAGMRPQRVRGGALRGRRLYFNLRHDTQAWRGIYEQALQEWICNCVTPGAVCVDVGAAEGYFTLLLALKAGRDGDVIAFEPGPRGQYIRRNLDLNADVPLAAVTEITAYAARADAAPIAADGTPQQSVDRALAELGLNRCDVIKIDVDGGEMDVLHGLADTLARDHPHLAVEVHSVPLRDAVLTHLRAFGYQMVEVAPPAHEHRPLGFNPTLFSKA